MMRSKFGWSACLLAVAVVGCGGTKSNSNNNGGTSGTGVVGGVSGIGGGTGGTSGTGVNTGGSGTTGGSSGTTGGSSGTGGGAGGIGGMVMTTDTFTTQFPQVTDWAALELVYPKSYSAFDGTHVFKVPIRVRCRTDIPISAWHADPADAVTFDADPNPKTPGGAMITIVKPVSDIWIGVVDGTKGGKAPLKVTIGTPEQWELGNQRYHNGSDWSLNVAMPMKPPPDTKCIVCHTANSTSGFNVMHTPTQIARVNDEGLLQIMTTGTKPMDVPFRVIPPTIDFGGMTYTAPELYSMFHLWQASDEQLKGMILYLRSLTPEGQGCVKNPLTGSCDEVEGDPNAECSAGGAGAGGTGGTGGVGGTGG